MGGWVRPKYGYIHIFFVFLLNPSLTNNKKIKSFPSQMVFYIYLDFDERTLEKCPVYFISDFEQEGKFRLMSMKALLNLLDIAE